jgi:hypothetical protein
MGLRTLGSNFLADLVLFHHPDDPGSEEEADQEGCDSGQGCSDSDIPEDIEEDVVIPQRDEKPVQHLNSP